MLPMLAGMLMNVPGEAPKIPSYKIEANEEAQLLSKRRIQKLKGKKNRKNRGNNR
jgi:hypothetical protein